MAQIPQSHIDNAELNAFLVRISDYSEGLAGRVMRGTPLSNDDREQLAALFEASGNIYEELQMKLSSGDIPVAAIAAEDFFESENSNAEHGGNASNAGQDEADSRYPTLIYDGPFSASRRGFRVMRSMKRKHIGVQRLFSAERGAKLNLRS